MQTTTTQIMIGAGVVAIAWASIQSAEVALRTRRDDDILKNSLTLQTEAKAILSESKVAKQRLESGQCRPTLNPLGEKQQARNPDGSIVRATTCLQDAHGSTAVVGDHGQIIQIATYAQNYYDLFVNTNNDFNAQEAAY